MSTHNICFRGEIRKILCGYPLLSVAMVASPESVSTHLNMNICSILMKTNYLLPITIPLVLVLFLFAF